MESHGFTSAIGSKEKEALSLGDELRPMYVNAKSKYKRGSELVDSLRSSILFKQDA